MADIRLKRVYAPADAADGARVLVDRLWPRGVKRETLELTAWCQDVAPSNGLRRWFGHDPARFIEFRQRYRAELAGGPAAADAILDMAQDVPVTLLYAARDPECNHARVLQEFLLERLAGR